MPKYYKKNESDGFEEVNIKILLQRIAADKGIDNAKNAMHPVIDTIESLDKHIRTYAEAVRRHQKEKPVMDSIDTEPSPPSKTEKWIELQGIAGEHNEEYMTKVERERTYTDEEYRPLYTQYENDHARWVERKSEAEQRYKNELEKFEKKHGAEIADFEDKKIRLEAIRAVVNKELEGYVSVPTYQEFQSMFLREFQHHQSERVKNRDAMVQAVHDIGAKRDLTDAQKMEAVLKVILNEYRSIIRSFSGTPTTFIFTSKGSSLANDLQAFCKDKLGLELPKTLVKGEPLGLDSDKLIKSDMFNLLMKDGSVERLTLAKK